MTSIIDPELLREAAERLASVRDRIDRACAHVGRDTSEVTLVGACKRQPAERIAASLYAGLRELGANYVQEARAIKPQLAALLEEPANGAPPAPARWRMIGHLQRNKAGQAVADFDTIDSVDSSRLARALDQAAEEKGRVLDVCLQANLSGEASKSGILPDDLSELVATASSLPHLRAVGLMTMPAPDADSARRDFARLRDLRDMLSGEPGGDTLSELNMGMSGDLEIAIEMGATVVRIGTDLFGERPPAERNPAG